MAEKEDSFHVSGVGVVDTLDGRADIGRSVITRYIQTHHRPPITSEIALQPSQFIHQLRAVGVVHHEHDFAPAVHQRSIDARIDITVTRVTEGGCFDDCVFVS